jgi:transcriptional regulator GlxA family with amidase domain
MHRADGADAQVFAVSSEPAELFRKRYGFIEFLDSRLSAPVDWVFVPGLAVARPWTPNKYLPLIRWLRRAADNGALLSSVGTGSFLLAEAGVLDGREAVTYSAHAEHFAERYPHVVLARHASHVRGERRLLTADLPWQELVLAVIGERWGATTAQLGADTYALHWERLLERQQGRVARLDPAIAAAQRWLSEHIGEQDVINRCVAHVGLARRTFNRRFKEATGATPMEFVQQARLQTMRDLLMFTNRSVEDICYEVGYEDAGALYRLFRRHFGTSPHRFRRQVS